MTVDTQKPDGWDDRVKSALGPVDLETAELEMSSSIYEGFSTAIMVKGMPRTIALCREYGDAVQLLALIARGREGPPVVGPANPEWEARAAALKAADREADPESYAPDATIEGLLRSATMLEIYVPDVLPANEQGQVPFVRAMTESVAETIKAYVAAQDAPGLSLTADELTWVAARAGVIDHEEISARPRPDELTAEGLLALRVKLAAALGARDDQL